MNQAPSISTITDILKLYLDAIDSGFGFIEGDVRWLFNALLVLNIATAAMFWAFSDDQVLVPLIRKAIYVGIFTWIIQEWPAITKTFSDTFMLLGLKAGGGRLPSDVLHHPGFMAEYGMIAARPIMQAVNDLSGPVGFFENFFELLLLSIAALIVIFAFFFVAIQMAMAILTFKLGTLVAFVLIPFSLFTHTTFIAERPLGWVITASVRFMLLTVVVSLGDAVFARLQIDPSQMTTSGALDIALAAILFMALALTATRLATDLATGTPRLGAMDAAIALSGTALAAGSIVTPPLRPAARGLAHTAKLGAVKAASALKSHFTTNTAGANEKPESAASKTNKESS